MLAHCAGIVGRDPDKEEYMAVKVMIPTPLRAYAGKQESVEVPAGRSARR